MTSDSSVEGSNNNECKLMPLKSVHLLLAYAYVSYDMYNHSVAGFLLLSASCCDTGRPCLNFKQYTVGGADPC